MVDLTLQKPLNLQEEKTHKILVTAETEAKDAECCTHAGLVVDTEGATVWLQNQIEEENLVK